MKTFLRPLRIVLVLCALLVTGIGCALGQELQIVCFGTSFTHGKGVSLSEAWPAKLGVNLKAQGLSVQVSNQGVDGDSTRNMKQRLARVVPEGTSVVILEYAIGNDRRAGIAMPETVKNVDDMVSQLVAKKMQVLLVIRARDAEGTERRAAEFKDTVTRFGISTILVEQPEPSLLADRTHPTPEAHTRVAASMVDPVRALLVRAANGQ